MYVDEESANVLAAYDRDDEVAAEIDRLKTKLADLWRYRREVTIPAIDQAEKEFHRSLEVEA